MKRKEDYIRQNAIVLALQVFVVTVIFNFLYLGISLVADFFEEFNNESFTSLLTYDSASFLFLMVLQFFLLLWLILRWYNNVYFVREGFLIHLTGIVFKAEQRFTLSTYRSVVVKQGFLGRLFQYGTVEISSTDKENKLSLFAVAHPYDFINWLGEEYSALDRSMERGQ